MAQRREDWEAQPMDRLSPGARAVDDVRFLLISGFYRKCRRNSRENPRRAERFLLKFRFLLASFGFYWRGSADEAHVATLRRPETLSHESQHVEALQNAATGRWTTTTRAIIEKDEKAEKDGSFPGVFQFCQSFSALKKMDDLEKDEAGGRDGGGGMG
jgi:hypothetical protein